jgi:hypothetical protein
MSWNSKEKIIYNVWDCGVLRLTLCYLDEGNWFQSFLFSVILVFHCLLKKASYHTLTVIQAEI